MTAEDHSHVDTFDTGGISHFTVLQHLNEIKCLNGLSTWHAHCVFSGRVDAKTANAGA